ncbi:hypothetical protein [Algibacter sp. 2305UL17-15]|uniref:hypothetical protein n=1 Tax=Algibacter sp. 2305UL17-15 TaxID=3231268 RepID=UPI0034598632
MKRIFVFLVCIGLTSCEYFNVKKTSFETILREELQTFNWKDVDTYPSFSLCDSLESKDDKKVCFQNTLTSHITEYLQKQVIVVTEDINDTLMLEFQVSNKGDLSLIDTKIDSLTKQEIPEIEAFLLQSLDSVPKIYPAIKRGQQVTTAFKMPLIIKVD